MHFAFTHCKLASIIGKVLIFGQSYEIRVAGLKRGARGPLKGIALTVNPLYDGLTAEAEASKSVRFCLSLQ